MPKSLTPGLSRLKEEIEGYARQFGLDDRHPESSDVDRLRLLEKLTDPNGNVTDTTIAACKSVHGKTIGEMCATMMSAFAL